MSTFQKLIGGIPTGTEVLGTDIGSGSATSVQFLAANGSGGSAFRSIILTDLPTINVAGGGTGQTTLTNHGVLIGAGTSAITQLAAAPAGTILAQTIGTSFDPSFTAAPILGINGSVNGTLQLNNGGSSGAGVIVQNLGSTSQYNFNLPTTAGSGGQVLTSQGGNSTPMIWTTVSTSLTALGIRSGQASISSAATSVSVTFSTTLGTTSYAITGTMANVTDTLPAFIPVTVTTQSATGATFSWNAPTATANYVLNWQAIVNN